MTRLRFASAWQACPEPEQEREASPQPANGADPVSLKRFQNSCPARADAQDVHRRRIAAALARRVGNGRDHELTVKQIAGLIGVSGQSVHNMLNARHDPSSYLMGQLVAVFGLDFLLEVYGELGAALWRRRERALSPKTSEIPGSSPGTSARRAG